MKTVDELRAGIVWPLPGADWTPPQNAKEPAKRRGGLRLVPEPRYQMPQKTRAKGQQDQKDRFHMTK